MSTGSGSLDLEGEELEVAAAGGRGHHLLLVGPPGCGKSMLARRLPGLLPPLTTDEALEVAAIRSVAPLPRSSTRRPEFSKVERDRDQEILRVMSQQH